MPQELAYRLIGGMPAPPAVRKRRDAAGIRYVGGRKLSKLDIAAAIAHEALSESFQEQESGTWAASSSMGPPSPPDGTLPIRKKRTGALQSVPSVLPAKEHLASALKRTSRLAYTAGIKNEAQRERNKAARQMDTLMKELSVPLTRYLKAFPDPTRLHPFEHMLLQLTVGVPLYTSILGKVDQLRKSLQQVGKAYAKRTNSAPSKAAALLLAQEGIEAMQSAYTAGAEHVDQLKAIAKKLHALPHVEYTMPTLALVGAPNVGKSSLVNILSSGTPEVCNYPFTTRSIKMGHFFLDGKKHQITDTPGLLNRTNEERNTMEQLTLAALACLPSSVCFVADLTEECGTSIADQWAIRCELQSQFPDKAWVDVFSKADMLQDVFRQADPAGEMQKGAGSSGVCTMAAAVAQPAHGNHGMGHGQQHMAPAQMPVAELGSSIPGSSPGGHHLSSAPQQQQQQQQPCSTSLQAPELHRSGSHSFPVSSESLTGRLQRTGADVTVAVAGPDDVRTAEEFVAQLPHALRVSSLTYDGIPGLQSAIIDLFIGADVGSAAAERNEQL